MNAVRELIGNLLVAARADRLVRDRVDRRLGNPLRILSGHRVVDAEHAVTGRDRDDLRRGCLTLRSFLRRTECLRRSYHVVALDAAADRLRTAAQLPPGAVALTFDDGFEDVFTQVYPALKRAAIPFTVFLTSGLIGRPGMLEAASIREMANDRDALIGWGAHGVTHRALTDLSAEEADREIAESKAAVESLVGRPVSAFCYPDGKHNAAIRDLVARRGFTLACATGRSLNAPPVDLLALKRIPFEEEPLWRFALRVAGRV